MKRIEQDHWYIHDNKMSISLSHNCVNIDIKTDGEFVVYTLEVVDEKQEKIHFDFYSLEKAITFAEEVVSICWTNKEVKERYEKLCEKKAFAAKPTDKNKIVHEGNTISLSPDEVLDILVEYFGEGRENGVEAQMELVALNDRPKAIYYLIGDCLQTLTKTRLTEGDLIRAFNHYLKNSEYEVVSFNYLGEVKEFGETTKPFYKGIELKVKEKEKSQKLVLKRED